jgi:hypothetical protein
MELLGTLLERDAELTVPQQRAILAGLAHSGKFDEPVVSCLLTAAEVAGDIDEILPAKLRKYLRWRAAAQRKAEGR